MEQNRILCVGLGTIDSVWICKDFPLEDTDQRCLEKIKQRGGNASNSSSVLAQLGIPCEYFGTIGNQDQGGSFLQDDMASYGINTEHCVIHKDAASPESFIIVNNKNGSRTIIHSNKNLPGLTYQDFKKNINLHSDAYKWIHFEARPTPNEISQMLGEIDQYNAAADHDRKIITSVELEKAKEDVGILIDKADYVFIGKEYAQFCGFSSKEETVTILRKKCRNGACVICPWGEDGASAVSSDVIVSSPVFKPENVIDTLGAGDTFNAATIAALSKGRDIKAAITFGCQVAGAKVGMQGYKGLQRFAENL